MGTAVGGECLLFQFGGPILGLGKFGSKTCHLSLGHRKPLGRFLEGG